MLANSTNLGTRFYTLKLCRLKSGTFSLFSDVSTKHCFLELNDEQSNIVHETLARQMQLYIQYRQISTEEGLCGLIEHIKKTYNLALQSVGQGSLNIKFRCPSLESLERSWTDCQSGHLNGIGKRYLVTRGHGEETQRGECQVEDYYRGKKLPDLQKDFNRKLM